MNRLWQYIMAYKGFILAAVLSLVIIGFYLWGRYAGVSRNSEAEDRTITFLTLAWQDEAIDAVRDIVNQWNSQHPKQPVELIQGTWNSVHDYLITGFETGDVPDIFHYESAVIVDFALRGYLADLNPFLGDELKKDVMDVAWTSVTRSDGRIVGVPFIAESFIVLYNKKMFEEAGIHPPDFDHPWTWKDLQNAAKKLTLDRDNDGSTDQWGTAMGLRSCANLIMNHSIAFGGSYFYKDKDGHIFTRVNEEEKVLLQIILDLLYEDKTMTPSSLGQSSSGLIPGFIAGRYAMLVGVGSWARQQVVENADDSFEWGVMPPIKAKTQKAGLNTQTFSIPKSCQKIEDVIPFLEFLVSRENMTRLALADWMMPTRESCLESPVFNTVDDGWKVVTTSAQYLSTGPWVGLPGYTEWKLRVANPVFQELFSNRITVQEAAQRIERESQSVFMRYHMRDMQW